MIYRSLLTETLGQSGAPSGSWRIQNPSNSDQHLGSVEFYFSEIDLALELASVSRPPMADAGLIVLTAQALTQNSARLYSWVSEESGRVEADFELELQHLQKFLTSLRTRVDSAPDFRPRGVCAVVGSSVWPVFYSIQFAIANLCVGNSVILKPAEEVTATVIRVIEFLQSVHPLWKGVQVLVGDRELGRRLVCHEAVSVVIFQGTFEVGMRVKQDTLSQPSKEVLLFLGAKNPILLLEKPTSNVEETLLRDAFLGAGQHCYSASQVWVKREHLDNFLRTFHERCKAFKIGGPGENALMGPMLDASVMDRYFKFIGISEREGAKIAMRGKAFQAKNRGYFVTPTLAVYEEMNPDHLRKSVSLQTEILAPHLSVIAYETEEQALETLGRLSYGHTASVYGPEGRARQVASQLSFGRIALNRGLYDFEPAITAQVFKRSGNHARLGLGLLEQLSRSQWIG